ncbi:MAG: polysaccharide deacetylase family protein, partial [Mailhella sp.]|nr:polysaccharide deacetylase family protein [Mailhella sp.]
MNLTALIARGTRILRAASLAIPALALAFAQADARYLSPSLMLETGIAKNLCVLTFDDGPGPRTPELLDILKEKGVKATFFVVGEMAVNPAKKPLFERMVAEGHEIGNHTITHRNLAKSSPDVIRHQLKRVQEIVESQGAKSVYLRPPYGAVNQRVHDIAAELGLPVILWSVDSLDWKRPPTFANLRSDREHHNRGVLLFHDIHNGTINNIGGIIDALKADGATFVSLAEFSAIAEEFALEKERKAELAKQAKAEKARMEKELKQLKEKGVLPPDAGLDALAAYQACSCMSCAGKTDAAKPCDGASCGACRGTAAGPSAPCGSSACAERPADAKPCPAANGTDCPGKAPAEGCAAGDTPAPCAPEAVKGAAEAPKAPCANPDCRGRAAGAEAPAEAP